MTSQPQQPGVSPTSQAANTPVILLVEDEPVVREVTRQVLEHAGYRVLEAQEPEEALRLAANHCEQIGLLLTDVIMPGMNGADLARRLQTMRPGLITVFMSGYAHNDVVDKIARTSSIHIQKPFTIDLLLSRVAEALRMAASAAPLVELPGLPSTDSLAPVRG
jgi:CheY-like chemotaxis protein